MDRKSTSIKINPETWKDAKKRAIDLDIEVSEYIEKLIKKELNDVTKNSKKNRAI